MTKTSPALATPLREQLEKLAAFEPQEMPVLTLYLNLAPNQHGRDQHDAFIRKAFAERQKAFKDNTPRGRVSIATCSVFRRICPTT